jgi:hypothetical protein
VPLGDAASGCGESHLPWKETDVSSRRPALSAFAWPILAGLLLGGCRTAATGPTEDSSERDAFIAASHGISDEELPFRMKGLGTLTGQDFAAGFGPPEFGRSLFGGRCSVPSDFIIRFSLAGEASHLGTYSGELEHCTQVDFATGLSSLTDGIATMTAADGDELWDRYERLVPGSGSVGDPEQHRFVGGTGRFAAASGSGLAVAVCDRAAGTCDFELEGVLGYDAAGSSN